MPTSTEEDYSLNSDSMTTHITTLIDERARNTGRVSLRIVLGTYRPISISHGPREFHFVIFCNSE